jgi:hypothetical protein
VLCAEYETAVPFFHQGQWFTIHDYDASHQRLTAKCVGFRNLYMSPSAFKAAIQTIEAQEKIHNVEKELQSLYKNQLFVELSKKVCEWGGPTGNRVWGNLNKRVAQAAFDANGNQIFQVGSLQHDLKEWLDFAHHATLPKQVVEVLRKGIKIKGLKVSYASKHLRLLFPDHFPVLDSLISERFDFAMNPSGYELFSEQLNQFKKDYPEFATFTLGQIESGIFKLIRNGVPPMFAESSEAGF